MTRRSAIIVGTCFAALFGLSFWQNLARTPSDPDPRGQGILNTPNALAAVQPMPQEGVIDVRSYGAVGDGRTDDTAAIQTAVATCAARGGGVVVVPPGDYAVVTGISLPSHTRLCGDGDVSILRARNTVTPINLVTIDGATDVSVERLRFIGSGIGNAITNANGLFIRDSSRVLVRGCSFFACGSSEYSSGGIMAYFGVTDLTLEDNYLADGVGLSSDIVVYSNSGYAVITGNRCYSANSQGIYLGAAAVLGKCIVTGNICMDHWRHGIVVAYGSNQRYIDTVVASNICMDNGWTGIYFAGDAGTSRHGGGGTTVIANNVISHCAGGHSSLSAGICIDANLPILVEGNYIYDSGKTSGGQARPNPGHAIRLNNGQSYTIQNNIVDTATGYGVHLYNFAKEAMIQDNRIRDTVAGVYLNVASGTTGLTIQNNRIEQMNTDGDGVNLNNFGGDKGNNASIVGNTVVGKKVGSGKRGLYVRHFFRGAVRENVFERWDEGLCFSSGPLCATLGTDVEFTRNRFTDSAIGCDFTFNDIDQWAFGIENVWNDCVRDVSANRDCYRNAIATHPSKVYYDMAPPTHGSWSAGDSVLNSAPTGSGKRGWICTVGGTPGTWKGFGTIDP